MCMLRLNFKTLRGLLPLRLLRECVKQSTQYRALKGVGAVD
jgi:hypothetical protein